MVTVSEGFRLLHSEETSIHETLDKRKAHSVAFNGSVVALVSACDELGALVSVDSDSGVQVVPYWAALHLGLSLVGPDKKDEWNRYLWAWLFDPSCFNASLAVILESGHFDTARRHTFSKRNCSLCS